MDWQGLWQHVLSQMHASGGEAFARRLDGLRKIPPPDTVSDQAFLEMLAETILGTGLSGQVCARLFPRLKAAFCQYVPAEIARDPEAVEQAGLAILRHKGKISAVVLAALRVAREPGVGPRLAAMTEREAVAYLQRFKFIGKVTSHWLARDLGIDVQHPDSLTETLAHVLGTTAGDMCAEIAATCGEKVGTVDLVLWWWLKEQGHDAYAWARMFAEGAGA